MKSPLWTLIAVYAVASLIGIVEYIGIAQVPDNLESPVHNFSAAMSRLYPRTAQAEFLLGRQFEVQAGQGFNRQELQHNRVLLKKYLDDLDVNLKEAARHYERAIALGLKSEENLYYQYAITLIRLHADSDQIDQAIAEWRREFPLSENLDLAEQRKRIEEQIRQLPTDVRPDSELAKPK